MVRKFGGGVGSGRKGIWGQGMGEVQHLLPHLPLPPPLREGEREREGPRGASGGHLTFPDGAIRGRGIVGEEEAGSVPAIAASAPRGDGALVFRGHGGLVDGWAVLVGKRSCSRVPIGAGICTEGFRQRHKGESEVWELKAGMRLARTVLENVGCRK